MPDNPSMKHKRFRCIHCHKLKPIHLVSRIVLRVEGWKLCRACFRLGAC